MTQICLKGNGFNGCSILPVVISFKKNDENMINIT